METVVRVATDDELEVCVEIWNAITPAEATTARLQRERRERDPRRLNVLAPASGE